MSTFGELSEAVTVPGDLDAVSWDGVEERRRASRPFGMPPCDIDLSFPDTVTLEGLPNSYCEVRLSSIDFGEWVSTDKVPFDDKALDEK
jgi:hypothetical protein